MSTNELPLRRRASTDRRVTTVLPTHARKANFWDKHRTNDKKHVFEEICRRLQEHPSSLLRETLPRLAKDFDGKALASLKSRHDWLTEFNTGSDAGFGSSKSAFFESGTEFIDALNTYTDLVQCDSQLGILLDVEDGFGLRLLFAIREDLERRRPDEVDRSSAYELSKTDEGILQANVGSGVDPSRVAELRGSHRQASRGNTSHQKKTRKDESQVAAECVFELHWPQWQAEFDKANPSTSSSRKRKQSEKDKRRRLMERDMADKYCAYLERTEKNLRNLRRGHIWYHHRERIRRFVSHVGCPQDHEDPADNINELRLFLSTTMGHFAKLQDQYLKKELEVQKLRHYITALEFRYLLERLPDPSKGNSAGSRWEIFWREAIEKEASRNSDSRPREPPHPLKSLVDQRNNARYMIDSKTKAKTIHTTQQKGFLFETGNMMYTALSDEIHRCNCGGEYEIQDSDGWTSVVAEILRALKPLDVNINADNAVDWQAERARYLT